MEQEKITILRYEGKGLPKARYRHVLLIEDDSSDTFIVTRYFGLGQVAEKLAYTNRAEYAIEYLENCPEHEQPEAIVVDLHLPYGMSGMEFAEWHKNSPLGSRQKVILTSAYLDSPWYNFELVKTIIPEASLVPKPMHEVVKKYLEMVA